MKISKIALFGCAAALAAVCMAFSASAADEIAIDEKTFPGEVFRDYVSKNFDADQNGVLSSEEIETAQSIQISYLDTHEYFLEDETPEIDITGINNFPELTSLTIVESKVTNADISGLNKLTNLTLGNSVAGLVIGDMKSLTYFSLSGAEISELVIDSFPELVQCYFTNNPALTKLEVTNCESLCDITCCDASLESLKIENCPHLGVLDCMNNKLTSLDLSDCPAIDVLRCSGNMIDELDITPCAYLIAALQKYDPAKDDDPLVVDKTTNVKGMELITTQASETDSIDSTAQESSDTQMAENKQSSTPLIIFGVAVGVIVITVTALIIVMRSGKKDDK